MRPLISQVGLASCIVRAGGLWVVVAVISIARSSPSSSVPLPMDESLQLSVQAEAMWRQPLTGYSARATLQPQVVYRAADGAETIVQTFSGLGWELWQADGPITLTVAVTDKKKRLSGVEVALNAETQKFFPAANGENVTASLTGYVWQNEAQVTLFLHEEERVVPRWKLTVNPERRGKPVRFLFEADAVADENMLRSSLGTFLLPPVQIYNDEIRREHQLKNPSTGMGNTSVGVYRRLFFFGHIPELRPSDLQPYFRHLIRPLSTAEDSALLERWKPLVEMARALFRQPAAQTVNAPFMHHGKVIITHRLVPRVLLEVQGEVPKGERIEDVRTRVKHALCQKSPYPLILIPSLQRLPGDEARPRRDLNVELYQRHRALTESLQLMAAQLRLANLTVNVAADALHVEPKSVDSQIEPITVTLQLRLVGDADCAYHQQKHTVPLGGVVRLRWSERHPLERAPAPPTPAELKSLDVKVEQGETVDVRLPWVGFGGASCEVTMDDWQLPLAQRRLSLPRSPGGDPFTPPQTPVPLTLRLEPTRAEVAVFLLELPTNAELKHASIVVQNEQGQVVASDAAKPLKDWNGLGIAFPRLIYGNYRVAAEGSYVAGGKEHPFSHSQQVRVQSYHAVFSLRPSS